MLNVVDTETGERAATISYAFEPPKPPFDDEGQVFLDPLNGQSDLSNALLELFENMIRNDRPYHDRLVRHYKMWKAVVDDPTHPDREKILSVEPSDRGAAYQTPMQRSGPRIGRNDPCPCGSGRKYKNCCWD